jgi:putative acetyltransferase
MGHEVRVRHATERDSAAVRTVIERAIRSSAAEVYPPSQIEAWASGGSRPRVATIIETTVGFVAVSDERVVGFSNLDGADVDQLSVDPEFGGRGVARRLYDAVEAEAIAKGLCRLTATASLRAWPAFERSRSPRKPGHGGPSTERPSPS